MDVIQQYKFKISDSIRKKSDLEKYLSAEFKNGRMQFRVFSALRERAFNPELNVSDGFYLSFAHESQIYTEERLEILVEEANKEMNKSQDLYEAEIEILSYVDRTGKFLVTRRQDKFAYDRTSMFSTKFLEENKIVVEVNFVKQIVYFQTSNVLKFRTIRTVIQNFLSVIFELEKLRLYPPKMSQQLNFTLSEDGKSATRYESINSNTIKLLDLLLEINNDTSKFSEFECVEITLDHEDSKKNNTKAKIDTQAFGGGDLLGTPAVNKLVQEGRIILEIDFKLVYNELQSNGQGKKHTIMAGIENHNSEYLRIYMHNNDLELKPVVNKAYSELNKVFIEHFSAKELRNEEKLKKLLGLR